MLDVDITRQLEPRAKLVKHDGKENFLLKHQYLISALLLQFTYHNNTEFYNLLFLSRQMQPGHFSLF